MVPTLRSADLRGKSLASLLTPVMKWNATAGPFPNKTWQSPPRCAICLLVYQQTNDLTLHLFERKMWQFVHSLFRLSCDRPTARSGESAVWCFLFQIPVYYLATGPQRGLERVLSGASSSRSQYIIFSLISYSSCLRHLFVFSSHVTFNRAVPTQDVTTELTFLRFIVCVWCSFRPWLCTVGLLLHL